MLAPMAIALCKETLDKEENASFLYTDCIEIDQNGSIFIISDDKNSSLWKISKNK